MTWQREILDFWFGLESEQHWEVDPALDATCRERFLADWEEQRTRPAEDFLGSADEALAAILLFDQMPRNMFRGDPRSFATDKLARDIAAAAVERGYDAELPVDRRVFVYLPFEHSEELADQDRSVGLFEALGEDFYADFARKHRNVIARFGRFPHRNAVLGRPSTEEEIAFGLEPAW
ncbi:MAG TPA: DUF924 family protein [Allosphingosinicella sp.]